jgi:hypothetical protein
LHSVLTLELHPEITAAVRREFPCTLPIATTSPRPNRGFNITYRNPGEKSAIYYFFPATLNALITPVIPAVVKLLPPRRD